MTYRQVIQIILDVPIDKLPLVYQFEAILAAHDRTDADDLSTYDLMIASESSLSRLCDIREEDETGLHF